MELAIPVAASIAGGAVGAGAAALFAPKPPKIASPMVPTRNLAAETATAELSFRRRRGAAANELTGGGAEAPSPGGKTLLGQ